MFYKPPNLKALLELINEKNERFLFLAGGTDINVMKKKGMIKEADNIIYINHLKELKSIKMDDNYIRIGALSTYNNILNSDIINKHLPFFVKSLSTFASPLIQTLATIGGNIANASPTNDVSPLLLVLDAKLILKSISGEREVFLKDFYTGYKKTVLKKNEIIKEIIVPMDAQSDYIPFYNKVASRNILAISKLSLAGLKKTDNNIITDIKIAVGSLNEYPRRLFKTENYLKNLSISNVDFSEIRNLLELEITPITDFRSDKNYRFEVCQNLLTEFLSK